MFRWATAGAMILGCVAAFTSYAPAGEAIALLRVNMTPASLLPEATPNATEYQVFKETQAKLLTSQFVLNSALRNLPETELAMLGDADDALALLQRQLVVDYPGKSEILRVRMKGDNAEELVRLVDAVVDAYLREVAQAERSDGVTRLDALRQAHRENEHAIRQLSEIVHHLAEEAGHADSPRGRLMQELERQAALTLQERIDRLRDERIKAAIRLAVRDAEKDATKNQRKKLKRLRRLVAVLNETITEQEEHLRQKVAQINDLTSFSSDLHTHKEELHNLQEANKAISREITHLELALKAPPRISLIQRATFFK